jgi:sugar diacid utilization regulator
MNQDSNIQRNNIKTASTSLLENIIDSYKLTYLALWEQKEDVYSCIFLHPESSSFPIVSKVKVSGDSPLFHLSPTFCLTYKSKGKNFEAAFHSYLQKNKHWLILLFETLVLENNDSFHTNFSTNMNQASKAFRDRDFPLQLLKAVIKSIPTADAGFFFLYDKKMNKLLIESAVGYDPKSYRKTQLSPGEAISGTAYEMKQPLVYNGAENIRNAMKTMTKENYAYYLESTMDQGFPNATLAVPMILHHEVIGVITINGFQPNAYFGKDIVDTTNNMMNYITLAYSHHQLHQKEVDLQQELDVTYKALRAEHTQLQRTSDLYNSLASLISKNKSIEDMMNAIYGITQTPISFYDELLLPIASVGMDKKRTLPGNFLSTREVQYAISVKRWQLISQKQDDSLLVIPVVGAETVIGFLCGWIDEKSFNDGNRLLLEYGASMLGLELMKKRAIEDTHRKLFGEVFEQIIAGNLNESVIMQAKNLRLSEKDYYAVLICEGKQDSKSFNLHFLRESWVKWIQQTMKNVGIHGLVTQRGPHIIAFLSISNKEDKRDARHKIEKFGSAMDKIPYDVRVGIGRVFEGFISVRKSYLDAQQCLEMLEKKKSGKVLRFADSGIYRLLLDHDKDELDLFVYDHLGPLIDLESKKDKELLQTLLAYVEYNRDLSQVTQKLSIHHNTLYYRIKRIEKILKISFSDHDEWFDVTIACKIYRFLNE